MHKEFIEYEFIRSNALKLAHKMYTEDNYVPDIIYALLRGGAYLANVISEYYKVVLGDKKEILFAALAAHSYLGVKKRSKSVSVEGWTYPPQLLSKTSKIMLVDDIYDSGNTINSVVKILTDEFGIERENIKVVVHDYKHYSFKKTMENIPDYWCRKFEISNPDDDIWIHYLSHELIGLSNAELEENYYKQAPELKSILGPISGEG